MRRFIIHHLPADRQVPHSSLSFPLAISLSMFDNEHQFGATIQRAGLALGPDSNVRDEKMSHLAVVGWSRRTIK